MTMKAATLTAILMVTLVSAVSHAQDFSADVVYLENSKAHGRASDSAKEARQSSKLYVSKGNIRLETNGLTGTVLVVNKEEHTAAALYPGKKSYQPLGSGPSEYFRVENADDACADWQRSAEQKIACERVGAEVVNGRETVKYQNKMAVDTAPTAVWVDKALKFVIKWESVDTAPSCAISNKGSKRRICSLCRLSTRWPPHKRPRQRASHTEDRSSEWTSRRDANEAGMDPSFFIRHS